jgi:hypothetical protein
MLRKGLKSSSIVLIDGGYYIMDTCWKFKYSFAYACVAKSLKSALNSKQPMTLRGSHPPGGNLMGVLEPLVRCTYILDIRSYTIGCVIECLVGDAKQALSKVHISSTFWNDPPVLLLCICPGAWRGCFQPHSHYYKNAVIVKIKMANWNDASQMMDPYIISWQTYNVW